MKKLFVAIFAFLFSYIFLGISTFAESQVLNFWDFLNIYIHATTKDINPEYQQVNLYYQNLDQDTMLYDALQRAVYLKLIANLDLDLDFSQTVKQKIISQVFSESVGFTIPYTDAYVDINWTLDLIARTLTLQDLQKTVEKDTLTMVDQTLQKKYLYPEKIPNYQNYTRVTDFLDELWDPYTQYLDAEQAQVFMKLLSAELVGIGVYFRKSHDGWFVVDKLVDGGVAQQWWLLAKDRLIAVDWHLLTPTMSSDDVVKLISGEEGTIVHIHVIRGDQELVFTLERAKIHLPMIVGETVKDTSLCTVTMAMFSLGSYHDFEETISDLHRRDNCEGYIFDLRWNGGGSLDDVAKILGYFVPQWSVVFSLEDKKIKQEYSLDDSRYQQYFGGKKLIILIDKDTASASEIFAGVIKHYHPEVLVVGATSFWKGTVQEVQNLSNWGLLKYTVARWLIGWSNIFIGWKGIVPDKILVDDPETQEDEVIQWVLEEVNK